jgi:hypothetical protein
MRATSVLRQLSAAKSVVSSFRVRVSVLIVLSASHVAVVSRRAESAKRMGCCASQQPRSTSYVIDGTGGAARPRSTALAAARAHRHSTSVVFVAAPPPASAAALDAEVAGFIADGLLASRRPGAARKSDSAPTSFSGCRYGTEGSFLVPSGGASGPSDDRPVSSKLSSRKSSRRNVTRHSIFRSVMTGLAGAEV